MLPTQWNPLGYVTIDTARLLLVDPMHVGGVDANTVEAKQIGIPGGDFSAVVVPTGLGDGRYPVEGRYADSVFGRRLAEVRIRFLDDEGNRLGADPKDPPPEADSKAEDCT
jgi:hypothetical protein